MIASKNFVRACTGTGTVMCVFVCEREEGGGGEELRGRGCSMSGAVVILVPVERFSTGIIFERGEMREHSTRAVVFSLEQECRRVCRSRVQTREAVKSGHA